MKNKFFTRIFVPATQIRRLRKGMVINMESIKGNDCNNEQLEEILDFANMVFSMSYGSIDFARLYPKAYRDGRGELVTHHMIREKGKIRALIDSYFFTLRLNRQSDNIQQTLKGAYIGTVSVHPHSRGRGYMTKLMSLAEECAIENGCAFMALDGNRHRYKHYGFERAGIRYSFNIGINNIAHCCSELYDNDLVNTPLYSFEEVDSDSPYLDIIYELYCRRNVIARTREDFLVCLDSGNSVTYVIIDISNGEMPVGYISLSEDAKNVLEFELANISNLPKVIYDFMQGIDSVQLGISVGMDEDAKICHLEKMCDYCNASMSHQIKILDYSAVFEFLLLWKQKYCRLDENTYVIGVKKEDCDKNYMVSIKDRKIKVTLTDKKADAVFDEHELVSLLTTNMYFIEQQRPSGKLKNAPAGWFPLPFYLPDADAF